MGRCHREKLQERTPRRAAIVRPLLLAALVALAVAAPTALAHSGGFGPATETRYQMPPWVLWASGAGVVALSFAVVGAFLTRPGFGLSTLNEPPAVEASVRVSRAARLGGLVVLAAWLVAVLNVVTGGDGAFPEALVWLVGWVVLPLVAYLWRDAWPALSPFAALAPLLARATPRAYPTRLAAWPAVALLLALTLLEVVEGVGHDARTLAALLLAYVTLTLVGMRAFGARAWLENAEVLTRTYATWGALGPLWRAGRDAQPVARDLSGVAFVVALLYGVNFDGFLATPLGDAALDGLAPLGTLGAHAVVLLAGYALFLGAFLMCARGIRAWAMSRAPVSVIAARFALSLLPIAIGYHVAHNLPYLVIEAPRLLVAMGDPLGLGWRPFGAPSLALAAWAPPAIAVFQMACIVGGHVLAVVVAHRLAFEAFASRVQAIRSEFPLTLVMVFYTFVGLWLVSGAYVAPGGGG